MSPLQDYLSEMRRDFETGEAQDETTFYPHLANLLNAIGSKMKPKVRCLLHPKNRGAGFPDGGLFSADQRFRANELKEIGQSPSRGVVEVKPLSDDAWATAQSAQVAKYSNKYSQVLVTNYRDFLLIGHGRSGRPMLLEPVFRLAESEEAFWQAARHPRATAQAKENELADFLMRALLHESEIHDPQQVAAILASYAREAMRRAEAADLPALAGLRKALEDALGMRFEGDEGEHFFRSTLVQTLFYGLFSAWVLWQRQPGRRSNERFVWHGASWHMGIPIIASLFRQLESPQLLKPAGLDEVLDWATAALNRVVPDEFFNRFEEAHAVEYFYEPFLQAFDPLLRKKYGVWYTPREVVKYMVERVDRVLRSELGLSDGLADPQVVVLDPCCGTGTYLVEVLQRIYRTLEAKGGDALTRRDVKQAAMRRVFGFEIMPAPYVVSHLQIGLLLRQMGVPLDAAADERAAVYLTNALTGWEHVNAAKQELLAFPDLQEERDRAEHVKQQEAILVVIGNPPYNAFAGTGQDLEAKQIEPYKVGLVKEWGIKKFNLDDLYVRFFRVAERRIAEVTKRGIVCFISNFSYLSDPSFVVMRKRLLQEFDMLWFDCLNGDSRETGKQTPDGRPDPSVFSTEFNREGIRVGTSIGLLARRPQHSGRSSVYYRDFWGNTKRSDLLSSLESSNSHRDYAVSQPNVENRFSFRPQRASADFRSWPRPVDLCEIAPVPGLQEMRFGALMSDDQVELERRMRFYFDPSKSWSEVLATGNGPFRNAGQFDAKQARAGLLTKGEVFQPANIVRYGLYPFDQRWAYWAAVAPLWNRPRPALVAHVDSQNRLFITRMSAERPKEGVPAFVTRNLPDYHLLRPNVVAIPFRIKDEGVGLLPTAWRSNLSKVARDYLADLGFQDIDASSLGAEIIWLHATAVIYARSYLGEERDGVLSDWPRIPLPASREQLVASAELGENVAALLDVELPLPKISTGSIRSDLRTLGVLSAKEGGVLDSEDDLSITTGWGHIGSGGAIMPGRGKAEERSYTDQERVGIKSGARELGLSEAAAFACLGETTFDVWLNGRAYWRNIPSEVWNFHIGGYQVIKKWLSYREQSVLHRALTPDEARYVMEMTRRLASILLLGPALDENYLRVKANSYPWPKSD